MLTFIVTIYIVIMLVCMFGVFVQWQMHTMIEVKGWRVPLMFGLCIVWPIWILVDFIWANEMNRILGI